MIGKDVFIIHSWPAFWTVICLGFLQVSLTYCGGHLTIESLPGHVPEYRRKTYRWIFTILLLTFVLLTFTLAKLNDSNQYQAEERLEQERESQEASRRQLQATYNTVRDSQAQLQQLKQAIDAHPPGVERSLMLDSISQIQKGLDGSVSAMKASAVQ